MKKEQDLAVSFANLQVQFHNVTVENTDLKKLLGDLQNVHNHLLETSKDKDNEIDVLKTQINVLAGDIDHLSRHIDELKADISTKELQYADLKTSYEKIAKEKEETQITDSTGKDHSNSQRNIKVLVKDNVTLKEQLKDKDKQIKNLSNECEDEKRNLENEFSRKEKQQKALENKLCTLKKQIENKNKAIEELQHENKSLKKKIKEGCKQCGDLESEVNGLHALIEKNKIQYEETINLKQVEMENERAKENTLFEEVQKLKLASDEAIKLQKETDVKCQQTITEMVGLMEKHKHQYDKLIEEKDVELCQLRAKEQETVCSKALLEKDLSNKNKEIFDLKTELQKEKEEKRKILKEQIQKKTNIKHKDVQTMYAETPKHSSKVGSIQTSYSLSRRSMLAELLSQKEPDQKYDHKVTSPWTSSKSCKYTTPKTYSVKTPPKDVKLHELVHAYAEEPAKKKQKVAVDFDFHSDSSDNTDILGLIKKDGIFKSLHMASYTTPGTHKTALEKKLTESSIKSRLALKDSANKNMSQAGWEDLPKVVRGRKMKATEK
ncbi:synaptonemal complex protein 1-like [Pyxicephalus adspersus]|uniref:synaptonemal complex protein 1-like n=1 Tax=Pyxicephalus adspersus TaxID=30357 RepID=UPI003B595CB8